MGKSSDKVLSLIKKDKKYKDMMATTGDDPHLRIDKLDFNLLQLDDILNGGLPYGRVCMIYGDFSSGKTFLTQLLIKSAQQKGKTIAYLDIDKTFEPTWWETVGIALNDVPIIRPNYGEQAFDLTLKLVEEGIDLVIMDSVDLLVPIAEAEASAEDSLPMIQARMIGVNLRKIHAINKKTIVLLLNHVREGMGRFSQHRIPGGKSLEDISAVMLWVAKGATIKSDDGKQRVGFNMRVTIEKDKIKGNRYASCQIPFLFEGGMVDNVAGLIELCLDANIITKQGSMYVLFGQKIRGKLGVKEYLMKNEDVQQELKQLLKEDKNGPRTLEPDDSTAASDLREDTESPQDAGKVHGDGEGAVTGRGDKPSIADSMSDTDLVSLWA